MLAAVELLPGAGVGEAVVGAAVDDDDVLREGRCDLRGGAVQSVNIALDLPETLGLSTAGVAP